MAPTIGCGCTLRRLSVTAMPCKDGAVSGASSALGTIVGTTRGAGAAIEPRGFDTGFGCCHLDCPVKRFFSSVSEPLGPVWTRVERSDTPHSVSGTTLPSRTAGSRILQLQVPRKLPRRLRRPRYLTARSSEGAQGAWSCHTKCERACTDLVGTMTRAPSTSARLARDRLCVFKNRLVSV